MNMLPAILTGKIIDDGFIGRDFNLVLILIAASLAVLIISSLLGVVQSYLNTVVAQRIARDMRNQMYGHLQRMSHRFFANAKQGEIITRMTSDIGGVQSVIAGTLTSTLSNIAVLLTLIGSYKKNDFGNSGHYHRAVVYSPDEISGQKRWSWQRNPSKSGQYQPTSRHLECHGQQPVMLFTNEERNMRTMPAMKTYRLNIKESMVKRWFHDHQYLYQHNRCSFTWSALC